MNPDIENPDAGALDRIAECTYMADCSEIKSADALPLAEYVIDRAEFQNVCTQTGSSSLHIGLKGMSGYGNVLLVRLSGLRGWKIRYRLWRQRRFRI